MTLLSEVVENTFKKLKDTNPKSDLNNLHPIFSEFATSLDYLTNSVTEMKKKLGIKD